MLRIDDSSQISAARRALGEHARLANLSEVEAGNAAIVLTEAATNMLKHAGGGQVVLRTLGREPGGVEVLAIDSGRGMEDWELSSRDGYSTGTTPGNGLGAMRRLSSEFDVYTRPGKGSVFRMAIWREGCERDNQDFELGVVCLPVAGEHECGDIWGWRAAGEGAAFMVADGLGHGPGAAVASRTALGVFEQLEQPTPLLFVDHAHGALRATRGAALSVVFFEPEPEGGARLRFAGVGNISVGMHAPGQTRQFASQAGIVGHNVRKPAEASIPWAADALLIMHSDGMATHWSLDKYPGLAARHAGTIAAVLYRDLTRGRDDVTVLVARPGRN
jgi:anti-sigma regulatory factor (Ser/Thr protein kinase)